MSSTHHAHETEQAHENHAHDEPVVPPEPSTPAWLTYLGVALFLGAGVLFIATRPSAPTLEQLQNAAAAPSASASASVQAPAPKVQD